MRYDDTPRTGRFQLLPQDAFLGWTPYVWLVYLPTLFVSPVLNHAGPGQWGVTIAAGVIFLALYFRGYWASGREFYTIVAAIAVLGFALVPTNVSASVFITYAAAFGGIARPVRRALQVLVLLSAAVLLEAYVVHIPTTFWLAQVVFIWMIGGVNIHFSNVRATSVRLRQAHEEIGHLATVAERERIARDLHDLLGHTLSLITIKSALAARIIEREPERAAAEIRDVERIAREAMSEVRATVSGYRDAGLARAVTSARAMLEAAAVKLNTNIEQVPLAPTEEGVLALAVREAITNVVRHARATTCNVTLSAESGVRELCIEDDGRGKHGDDGNGLNGMRERVTAIGGALTMDSGQPGGFASGTRLRITLRPSTVTPDTPGTPGTPAIPAATPMVAAC